MRSGPSAFNLASMAGWLYWISDASYQREADALIGAPSADDYARLAQARAKLNTAEKFGTNRLFYLAAQTEHDYAQQVAVDAPVILQRADGTTFVSLLRALGLWELQRHQWREALTNWSLVIYGPSGRGSLLYGQDLSRFYLSFAPLLVELDDGAGYERFRTNALATFGGTAVPTNAARTLEACLLRPPEEKLMPALKELATILPATPALPTGFQQGISLWRCSSLGAAIHPGRWNWHARIWPQPAEIPHSRPTPVSCVPCVWRGWEDWMRPRPKLTPSAKRLMTSSTRPLYRNPTIWRAGMSGGLATSSCKRLGRHFEEALMVPRASQRHREAREGQDTQLECH